MGWGHSCGMNRLSDRIDAHCPRCNAAFVVSPSAQTKRIQCPNCRRIIALGVTPELPTAGDSIAERFAKLEARLTRQEARLEELLARKTIPAEIPTSVPPSGDSLLSPGQNLRWIQRDSAAWSTDDYEAEQQKTLLHNLQAMGQRDVIVQAGLSDTIGQRLAARLASVLREAGWRVSGPNSSDAARPVHGLVITAGECPLPKAATAAYMALQAAGFPVTSRLESTLGPEGWILIVGSTPESVR